MKKVMLFLGGWSAEREVSLSKGKAVKEALEAKSYEVVAYDVPSDPAQIIADVQQVRPDVIFNNLYGRWGEDGHIQALLNLMGVPYTHSGLVASAAGMDKPLCKQIAASLGIDCPEAKLVSSEADIRSAFKAWDAIVVKPCAEGSSIHTLIIQDETGLQKAARTVADHDMEFMAEAYIPGQELTVAVLDGKAQNVTEIVSEQSFFDYEAKYNDPGTRYVMPAPIPEDDFQRALSWSQDIYQALKARGIARCDYRYDPKNQRLCFLEINTQPGLTEQSIGPSQVIANGMSFADFCAHLVEGAQCD